MIFEVYNLVIKFAQSCRYVLRYCRKNSAESGRTITPFLHIRNVIIFRKSFPIVHFFHSDRYFFTSQWHSTVLWKRFLPMTQSSKILQKASCLHLKRGLSLWGAGRKRLSWSRNKTRQSREIRTRTTMTYLLYIVSWRVYWSRKNMEDNIIDSYTRRHYSVHFSPRISIVVKDEYLLVAKIHQFFRE